MGKVLAKITLALGWVSPLRLVSGPLNRRLRRDGGRPFTATAHDGISLDAIFLPATNKQPGLLPIIASHGLIEIKEFHERGATLFRQHGHDVILYDLRSHGRSGGRFTTFGAWEKRDHSAVIDAAAQHGMIDGRVISMGYSTSAAIVIQNAPLDDRVAAVVAIAPYADLTSAIKSFRRVLYGYWYNEAKLLQGFAAVAQERGFSMDEARTDEAMKQVTVPVLLMAGTADRNLPPHLHAERLAPLMQHKKSEFVRIPGAGHVTIYWRTRPKLDEALLRFCAAMT